MVVPLEAESTNASPNTPAEAADVRMGAELAAAHRHKAWARYADKAAELGDQEPLYAVGAGMLVIGLFARSPKLAKTGFSVLARVSVADLSKRLVKRCVKRTRPAELLDHGRYETDTGGGDDHEEQSFPSGHVACTLAAAIGVSRHWPVATPAALGFTGLVGVARVVKGEHWPADVAAGFILGVVADALVSNLESRLPPTELRG